MVVFLLWLGCFIYICVPVALLIFLALVEVKGSLRGWICLCLMSLWFGTSVTLIHNSLKSFFS